MSQKEDREDFVIIGLCRFLSLLEHLLVHIIERPDREQGGGCEAIVDRAGKKQAVEHTRLDAFQGQKADDAVFNEVVAPLETGGEIVKAFPNSYVEISVPVRAALVAKGRARSELRDRLLKGCLEEISRIPQDGNRRSVQFRGVSFPVTISHYKVHGNPKCIVSRIAPENIAAELEDVLVKTLKAKNLQLVSYARDGYNPLLVIDNDDVALLDRYLVAEAFKKAVARAPGPHIREIYVADTGHGALWFYPLRIGGRDFPNLPEFEQHLEMQVLERARGTAQETSR